MIIFIFSSRSHRNRGARDERYRRTDGTNAKYHETRINRADKGSPQIESIVSF